MYGRAGRRPRHLCPLLLMALAMKRPPTALASDCHRCYADVNGGRPDCSGCGSSTAGYCSTGFRRCCATSCGESCPSDSCRLWFQSPTPTNVSFYCTDGDTYLRASTCALNATLPAAVATNVTAAIRGASLTLEGDMRCDPNGWRPVFGRRGDLYWDGGDCDEARRVLQTSDDSVFAGLQCDGRYLHSTEASQCPAMANALNEIAAGQRVLTPTGSPTKPGDTLEPMSPTTVPTKPPTRTPTKPPTVTPSPNK